MILLTAIVALAGCESFDSRECGDLYIHTYYGGGPGGYRFVDINEEPTLRFASPEDAERYLRDETPKVSFENDNPMTISCGAPVEVTADSRPITNTLNGRVTVEVVEPYQLLELDEESSDVVIW